MRKSQYLVGQKFGKLSIVKYAYKKNSRNYWWWECECGNYGASMGKHILSGATRSCNKGECCYRYKGGHAWCDHIAEYDVWKAMKARCSNPHLNNYHNYGGRGIVVCDRWLADFRNFLSDMGLRPSAKHSIERIDNDGHYDPDNCRWATKADQCRNKRNNVWLELDGERMIQSDWDKRLGFRRGTVLARLKRGWTVRKTLTSAVMASCA